MYPVEEFRDSVSRISDIFRGLSVRFHLTGGAATIVYSEPRLTQDIDIVVDQSELNACTQDFIQSANLAGFTFEESAVIKAVSEGRSFQLLDVKHILKIDLYPRELIAGELDRTIHLPVFEGFAVPVVALQDLILSKLIWISHGSGKSQSDLRHLWQRASDVQRGDVHEYANRHKLNAILDETLSGSDEINV